MKTSRLSRSTARSIAICDARADNGRFIEQICDAQRLRTALAYRSPIEFEELHRAELQRGANIPL